MSKLFASIASQLFTPRTRTVKISVYSAGAVTGQSSGTLSITGSAPTVSIA